MGTDSPPRPGAEKERDRVFSEDELKRLWAAFGEQQETTEAVFKLEKRLGLQ